MSAVPSNCQHCGTPVPDSRADGFCCAGCAYVFEMLHSQGFAQFYDLKAEQALPPVSPQAMREQDLSWLDTTMSEGCTELTVAVQGLSCVGCIWLIERLFTRMGGSRVLVDMSRGELTMSWPLDSEFTPQAFARELQNFGYLMGPQRSDAGSGESSLERRTGVCGAFAMNAMAFSLPAYFGMPKDFMFAPWFDIIAAMSATFSMLIGGSYFAERSWRSLRVGVLHIDTPITLGIVAAYMGSLGGWLLGVDGLKYFDFVAMFIFLMLGGRWVQQAAVARNRRMLLRDSSIAESVIVDGKPLPVAELQPGMNFSIRPGQAVPVAASLLEASASVSLEWINGESEAQHRNLGQMLPSGALNIGMSDIEACAMETWPQSTLHRLLEARGPAVQRDLRLEKLLRVYLLIVVVVGLVGGAAWWWFTGDIGKAMQVMISIFVVSCPCALGVAAPFADDLAAAKAERLGVFVRTIGLWKKLADVRQMVFDKTGTLTLENPVLVDAASLQKLDDQARSALRHLVRGNLHPVSRSLFDQIGPGEDHFEGCDVTEVAGMGLSFTDAKGHTWSLGRSQDGSSDAVFSLNDKPLAGFEFRDALRDESVSEVQRLLARGISVQVLSGDREAKVADIAAQLALTRERWCHSLLPEQKAQWIEAHDASHTLFIGDGANDSLAFDAARCAGSPVSGRSFLEHKADFYFLGHSMRFATALLDTAQQHRIAVRRVFGLALSYNIVTVCFGLAGHLNPLAAAILMPLSSVATLSLVGLTLRRRQPRVAKQTPPHDKPLPVSLDLAVADAAA